MPNAVPSRRSSTIELVRELSTELTTAVSDPSSKAKTANANQP
jgi:hypothetical protein